jgi:hypothetical protein
MKKLQLNYRLVCILCLAMLSACGGGGDGSSSPGTLQIEATSFDVREGAIINIRVARSGGSSGVASIDFATMDETAVDGTDYTAANGTLTWANGVAGNRTISIPIADDSKAEFTESFTLVLSNASGATLGANSSVTVNIIDINGVSQALLNMDVGTTINGFVETGQGTGHSILYYHGSNVTVDIVTDSISEVIRLGDTKP